MARLGGGRLLNAYVRGGDSTNNNNIEINSVSGTLVKNYRKSFFFKCKEDSITTLMPLNNL